MNIFGNNKVLIAGASGFIGRNLYEKLKSYGVNVIGTQCSKNFKEFITCDLGDYKQTEEILQGADYVFMLASKTYGAKVMVEKPYALVRENLLMYSNMLDLCYKKGIKKVLFVSSSTVYQESYKPLAEEELDWNKDPYCLYMGIGWVSRYAEQLCNFYSRLGLKVNVVRPTGIYGKYDKYEEGKSHFLPAIIKRALEKQNPLVVWGNGNAIKNLIYVDDFIRDMLKVFAVYDKVDAINLCSDEEHSIKEIVEIIRKICGHGFPCIYDKTKPEAIPYRGMLRNKFDSVFGRENYTPLKEGMENVAKWIKEELA